MEKTVSISMQVDEFRGIIIDCFNACLQANSQSAPAEPDLMTVPMVAEFLNLKTATIYGLIHKGEIPNFKRGKRVYFSRKQLLEWIESGSRRTIDEVKAGAEQYLCQLKKRKH